MEAVAKALGVSIPVLQFLICFAFTLPVSFLRRFVVGSTNRHAYSAFTGIALSYYGLGVFSNLHFSVPICVSYASMLLYRKRCGQITFASSFMFLIMCHVYYMSGDAWKNGGIDSTGAMMVLTLKVVSAAMNYQDGLLEDGDLRDAQKKYRLIELPSFMSYLGYCLCCGTLFAGPVFEIKDYFDWTEDTGLWSESSEKPPPSPYSAALKAFCRSLCAMGIYIYLTPRVPLSRFGDELYQEWGLWKRIGYQILSGFSARWKYYFVWSLAESSVILSGFGFSGWKDSEANWDRARNVDILKVELAKSASELPVYWNIHVSTWLRHYVYERLIQKGKKPGFWQLLATQIVSAVWHGLYAGYVFFFANSALMIAGSKVIYRWQRPLPEKSMLRKALVVVSALYASFVLNTTCIGFLVLGMRETLAAYSSIYYMGTLVPLTVTLFGVFVQPPAPSKSRLQKSE